MKTIFRLGVTDDAAPISPGADFSFEIAANPGEAVNAVPVLLELVDATGAPIPSGQAVLQLYTKSTDPTASYASAGLSKTTKSGARAMLVFPLVSGPRKGFVRVTSISGTGAVGYRLTVGAATYDANAQSVTDGDVNTAAALAAAVAAQASADALLPTKHTITIAFGLFSGLAGGVKTYTLNDTAGVLPANSRIVGKHIRSFTGFDDAAHGEWNVSIDAIALGDVMADTSVKAGASAASKVGADGRLGYPMAPVGGATLSATVTSDKDLNTATVGTVTVDVWTRVQA